MIPHLEPLEARLVPTEMTKHGGPVLAHPQVNDVFVGLALPPMDQLAQVLTTQYAAILAPYGVGAGGLHSSITVPDPGPLSNAAVQRLLATEIAAGLLPVPDGNQLYMVYVPQQVTDAWAQQYAAYHSAFTYHGVWVPYAVVPAQPNESIPASHEFAETVTDPVVGTGWFGANTGEEIADVYNWQAFHLDGFPVTILAAPDGTPLVGPGLSEQAALMALPIEELFAFAWSYIAWLDPLFAPQAHAAVATLQANPMYGV
jgi:hypothetical protein